jgi:hypothetical protein
MRVWEVVGNLNRMKKEPTDFQQVFDDGKNYPNPDILVKIPSGIKRWFESEANEETMIYIMSS